MPAQELALAQAASQLTPADLQYLNKNGLLSKQPADSRVTVTQDAMNKPGVAAQPAQKKRKRHRSSHEWPDVGTILDADYHGVHYAIEVISAPRYRSGRALKVLTGPSAGTVCHSFSGAMLAATEVQRREHDLGRKGVASGWGFWKVKGGADQQKQ